eukprot:GHVN01034816.1.p2 GENE.GHVN01034816.1~~GHVN01034816.1.p2  ORF type:complete len:258 (+),score=44.46 GHVN01034816.1:6210-6983(+)
MTQKAPSNPSPFSPELQSFVVTKFDPLLSIVKELNDRLQASDKDRFRLEQRVTRLENQLKAIQEAAEAGKPISDITDMLNTDHDLKPNAVAALLENEDALAAPWLFSCQTGTPTSVLQLLLEFNPESTEELDTKHWRREEDMWVSFLEYLPDDVAIGKPDSLSRQDLRKAARRALLQLCRSELLVILRNVPGKEDAATNPTAITLTAIITAALSEAWQRVEHSDPDSLGRIGMVLEGTGIGTRLRAGHRKFQIEPLN